MADARPILRLLRVRSVRRLEVLERYSYDRASRTRWASPLSVGFARACWLALRAARDAAKQP